MSISSEHIRTIGVSDHAPCLPSGQRSGIERVLPMQQEAPSSPKLQMYVDATLLDTFSISTDSHHINQEIYMSLRPPASPDAADNPRFAAILAKARELAYPKANLEAAIAKVRFGKS